MLATLNSLFVFAVETGNGRGENPDDGGGVLIVIGVIALLAIVVVGVGLLMRARLGKDRTTGGESEGEHAPGGVGRVRGSG